jgi:two-component system sensor histidine kinase VicK
MLTNALNYTPDGGAIGVRAFQRDDRIAVEIQDNGIGIRKEDLPHIFERFFRADAARGTESGGVGLGLTIARRIIEAHGGDIEVESGRSGTTVRVAANGG